MGEATDRELKINRERAAAEAEHERKRVEWINTVADRNRQEFESSEAGQLHRDIKQAERDSLHSPAPDRGGFGDHSGDPFAEVPENRKPKGASPADPSKS